MPSKAKPLYQMQHELTVQKQLPVEVPLGPVVGSGWQQLQEKASWLQWMALLCLASALLTGVYNMSHQVYTT